MRFESFVPAALISLALAAPFAFAAAEPAPFLTEPENDESLRIMDVIDAPNVPVESSAEAMSRVNRGPAVLIDESSEDLSSSSLSD